MDSALLLQWCSIMELVSTKFSIRNQITFVCIVCIATIGLKLKIYNRRKEGRITMRLRVENRTDI